MKKNVGLWIDHSKAILVFLTGNDEEIQHISSDTENHPHSSVKADDVRLSVKTEYLNKFYDEIISCMSEAESVFIFGPSEAKSELKKRLENNNHSDKTISIEPSDNLTEPQIVARVRDHFSN